MKPPVTVTLTCEAHPSTETVEIDRADWDAMTPAERADLLDVMAAEHVASAGGYGWHISNPDDAAATEDATPPPATWALPAEPANVTAVRDRNNKRWNRTDNGWQYSERMAPGVVGSVFTWTSLVVKQGPLTDATGQEK